MTTISSEDEMTYASIEDFMELEIAYDNFRKVALAIEPGLKPALEKIIMTLFLKLAVFDEETE